MAKEMTKEEAIRRIEAHMIVHHLKERRAIKITEALKMAIKALEQEPCEDCISRQTVIDSIRNYFHDEYYQRTSIQDCRDCLIEDAIKSLPPVTPIRPKGEWKYDKTIQNWRCSKCNETPKTLGYVGTKEFMTEHFKFCNHCGADMRTSEDM